MSSANTNTNASRSTTFSDSTEFHIYDVATELISEICSLLQVHDQMVMKRVCKWWSTNLNATLLSRLVDMDASRMPSQSETSLEHALNMHLHKKTQILVIRRMVFKGNEFGIVARVIQQKHAVLIQLTLKDCEVQKEYAAAAYWWTHPQHISPLMMQCIIFATKKLVLENYTTRDALSCVLGWSNADMPCSPPDEGRDNFFQCTPVVLPRYEFDCTKPVQEVYYSFIMALNNYCPEVCPEIRNTVVMLYNSWIHCDASERQWRDLGNLIKCLNEGVAITFEDFDVNVPDLRHLDPLTFSKLTLYALYRLYF